MSPPLVTNWDRLHFELFRRKYLQMIDPLEIAFPYGELIKPLPVQDWLVRNMFDKRRLENLPTARYTFRIMKKLLSILEDAMEDPEEDEILNDLTDCFTDFLVRARQDEMESAQEKCPVTYTAPVGEVDAPTVTILEAPFLLSCGGDSGNRTWAAALHLATYLFTDGRYLVENKSILELGAGLGFLSILCGKHLGAKHVLMTDGSEAVMDLAQGNVELNGVEGVVETSVLEWGAPCIDDVLQDESGLTSYDLVLGADI
ncbi:MAG: hypothetical protein Q9225_007925, partial [Loekoesia sp. 1 TL-2023]